MSDTRLVIFDLDGTLVDAYPAIINSFNYTMQRLNCPKQPNLAIRRAVGWGDENLLKPFINLQDLKKALRIYRSHHRSALLKSARLFPMVKKVLFSLKNKKYKLAIASNRPTKFTRILTRHLKLSEYFNDVLCSDVLKKGKPNPEILNKIIQRLKVKPAQAIYVGDMTIDAQAGRRAGIKTIIVTTGSSSKVEIKEEKPYRIISKISQLLNISF